MDPAVCNCALRSYPLAGKSPATDARKGGTVAPGYTAGRPTASTMPNSATGKSSLSTLEVVVAGGADPQRCVQFDADHLPARRKP